MLEGLDHFLFVLRQGAPDGEVVGGVHRAEEAIAEIGVFDDGQQFLQRLERRNQVEFAGGGVVIHRGAGHQRHRQRAGIIRVHLAEGFGRGQGVIGGTLFPAQSENDGDRGEDAGGFDLFDRLDDLRRSNIFTDLF